MGSHSRFMKLPKLRLLGESEQPTAPSTPALHERIFKSGHVNVSGSKPLAIKRRRVLVLTERVLRWYAASRREVGCIDLSSVSDVRPSSFSKRQLAFEVTSRLHKPHTFEARSTERRDEWIDAIRNAASLVQQRDRSKRGETRTPTRRVERQEAEEEEVRVGLVTCRLGDREEVVWRGDGDSGPIDLAQRRRSDVVLVWLGDETHVHFTGDAIADSITAEAAIEGALSDDSGVLKVYFKQQGPPTSPFARKETLAALAALLLAMALLPAWTTVLLLALCAYGISHKLGEVRQSLGRVAMVVERFEAKPTVAETSLASSAASNDPWVCDEATGVPPLFLSGCVGNVTAAREKWARAREWRKKFEIDQILERPHPLFAKIGECYTDCFLPNARNGDSVYLGLLGPSKPRALANSGLKVEDLLHHLIFCAEFSLKHVRADANRHMQIFIYDLDGNTIRHLDSMNLRCIRDLCSKWHQSYTGHERYVLLINAPAIFPFLWSVTRSFVNQSKRDNIKIASKGRDTYNLLARFLHHKDIPAEYGGGLVLPRGIKADRHLIPNQARLMEHIESLDRAYPNCKEHMPVV